LASSSIVPDLWPAEADPRQIRQVLENLLVNARQCQGTGGWIRVRGENVRLGAGEPAGDSLPAGRYVRLTVTDGGPGIAADVARRVFDPFFTTRPGGSGLGLATALSVIHRHGGRLSFEPAAGGGTSFRVLLPASDSDVSAPERRPARRASEGSGRVLVVDDQEEIRAVLVRMLGELGYEARAAAGCDEALRLLEAGRAEGRAFGYAIVDLTLPGDLEGPEILERMREREPGLRAAASSGYSESAVLAHHADWGFQSALPKPYRMEELSGVMGELAEHSPAEEAARGRAGAGA